MWGGRRKKVGEREEGVGSAGEPASARPRAAAAARTVAGGGGGRRRQPGEGCGRRRGVPPESPTRAARFSTSLVSSNMKQYMTRIRLIS